MSSLFKVLTSFLIKLGGCGEALICKMNKCCFVLLIYAKEGFERLPFAYHVLPHITVSIREHGEQKRLPRALLNTCSL